MPFTNLTEVTMRIKLTVRHGKTTEEVQQFAETEVQRLKKYYDGIIDCDIILDYIKRLTKVAEIHITVYGSVLKAVEEADEIEIAIKQAVDKLERQLMKYKDRLRDFHHEKAVDHIRSEPVSFNNEEEE